MSQKKTISLEFIHIIQHINIYYADYINFLFFKISYSLHCKMLSKIIKF